VQYLVVLDKFKVQGSGFGANQTPNPECQTWKLTLIKVLPYPYSDI